MSEKKPVVSPEKKRNLKQTIKSLLAMVLVAVIAVLGTLAYLGANSEKKENTFIGSEGISLVLHEDKWEEKPDGGESEEERARNYTPGVTYQKDPLLENTTSDADEWVAIKVSFELGTKSEEADEATGKYTVNKNDDLSVWKYFSEIATIASTGNTTGISGFNTGTGEKNWTLIATETNKTNPTGLTENDSWAIFVYNSKLARTKKTATLFDTVTMQSQEVFTTKPSNTQYTNGKTWIYTDDDDKLQYALPAFNINVIGAAIKVETENDVESDGTGDNDWQNSKKQAQVKTELLGLLENK